MPRPRQPDVVQLLQVITAALIAGVVVFLLIAITVLRRPRLDAPGWAFDGPAPISLVALAFAAVAAVLSEAVPRILFENGIRALARGKGAPVGGGTTPPGAPAPPADPDRASLQALLQTTHIVRLALLEGAAFFNIIAFFVEGKAWPLAAAVVLLLLMVRLFPTRPGVEMALDDARARLDQVRGSGF